MIEYKKTGDLEVNKSFIFNLAVPINIQPVLFALQINNMNVFNSLRQMISKAPDNSDDESSSSSSSSTRSSSSSEEENEDERKAAKEEGAEPEDKNEEEEASDDEDFSDEDEEESDVYSDLVAPVSSLLDSFRSRIGYGIPTDLISTRTGRDDISPQLGRAEFVKPDDEQKSEVETTQTAEDDDFDDVSTAHTVESQTNLVAQEVGIAQQDQKNEVNPPAQQENEVNPPAQQENEVNPPAQQENEVNPPAQQENEVNPPAQQENEVNPPAQKENEVNPPAQQDHRRRNDVTPPFESAYWHGQPNASRHPPCKCKAKHRATCTCSFYD